MFGSSRARFSSLFLEEFLDPSNWECNLSISERETCITSLTEAYGNTTMNTVYSLVGGKLGKCDSENRQTRLGFFDYTAVQKKAYPSIALLGSWVNLIAFVIKPKAPIDWLRKREGLECLWVEEGISYT